MACDAPDDGGAPPDVALTCDTALVAARVDPQGDPFALGPFHDQANVPQDSVEGACGTIAASIAPHQDGVAVTVNAMSTSEPHTLSGAISVTIDMALPGGSTLDLPTVSKHTFSVPAGAPLALQISSDALTAGVGYDLDATVTVNAKSATDGPRGFSAESFSVALAEGSTTFAIPLDPGEYQLVLDARLRTPTTAGSGATEYAVDLALVDDEAASPAVQAPLASPCQATRSRAQVFDAAFTRSLIDASASGCDQAALDETNGAVRVRANVSVDGGVVTLAHTFDLIQPTAESLLAPFRSDGAHGVTVPRMAGASTTTVGLSVDRLDSRCPGADACADGVARVELESTATREAFSVAIPVGGRSARLDLVPGAYTLRSLLTTDVRVEAGATPRTDSTALRISVAPAAVGQEP